MFISFFRGNQSVLFALSIDLWVEALTAFFKEQLL